MLRSLAGSLVIVACGGPAIPPPSISPAAPVVPLEPAPAKPVAPDSRSCGEAGDSPTELPPQVASGRSLIGSGVVLPDTTLQIGKVTLRYASSTWHGTTRAGQRGPGLHIEIDRAEVGEHAPWGTLEQLDMGGSPREVAVGPYHILMRVAAGDPPAEVGVTVTREVCPAVATIAPGPAPTWFWISTQAIGMHREATGMGLTVGLDLRAQQPWLTVRDAGYQQMLLLRSGPPIALHTGASTLTIERVEQYAAQDEPRVHALVRIDASPKISFPAPVPATSECGEASPARSATPPALAVTPKIAETRNLKPAQKLQFGPLSLEYGSFEIPAHGGGPYREEARTVPNLQILGPNRIGTSISGIPTEPRLLRIDRALLRVTSAGADGILRAERIALACTAEQVLPPLRAPLYLWLGTLGHTYVRIGEFDVKALNLQVYPDSTAPGLNIGSEHGSLMRPLDPGLVGLGVTIDDYRVEIVDVELGLAGPDGLGPPARVQLRVAPRT